MAIETVSAYRLFRFAALPPATATSTLFFHGSPLGDDLLRRLHGARVLCGSFIAVYRSGQPTAADGPRPDRLRFLPGRVVTPCG